MAVVETWLKSDLKKPITVKQLPGALFLGDDGANLIGVEITSGGNHANLTGDVYGYIIRDDDDTIVVQGTLTGGCMASITLPATAYAIPGNLSIVIKVGETTVGACVGRVYRAQTDTIADPDNIIPSVQELLAKIAAAIAAGEEAVAAKDIAVAAKEVAVAAAAAADEAATARQITPSQAIAIPAAGSSASYDMDEMTENYEVVRWNFSASPENSPPANVSITTHNGYFTITNNYGTTSETVKPLFGRAFSKTISTHTA